MNVVSLGARIAMLEEILSFIDTLEVKEVQEEPVSNNYSALLPCIYNRTLEERVKYCKYCSAACEGRVKEPVSEDLEEAIDTYLATYFGGEKEKQDWPFLKKMAIHFAQWQRQKDEHLIWQTSSANWEKGIEEGKKQMMKSAVECYIGANKEMTHKLLCFSPRGQKIALDDALSEIRIGDKVRVIIIKEE